jgi:formate C-acetyltransferase
MAGSTGGRWSGSTATRGFESFEDVLEAFRRQLRYLVDVKIRNNVIERLYARLMPAPYLRCWWKTALRGAGLQRRRAVQPTYIMGVAPATCARQSGGDPVPGFRRGNLSMGELLRPRELRARADAADVWNRSPKFGNDDAGDLLAEGVECSSRRSTGVRIRRGRVPRRLAVDDVPVYFGSVTGLLPTAASAASRIPTVSRRCRA